jgi:2-phosphoglycerate kinase
VSTDISKCLTEGKPVIIEGITLNPDLFLKQASDNKESSVEEEKKTTELIQMYLKNEIKMKKH